jgi:hypothetical protein
MGAILPLHARLVNQFQKCFVNQSRCLQGVGRTLAPEVAMRDFLQLAVNERQKLIHCIAVAFAPFE